MKNNNSTCLSFVTCLDRGRMKHGKKCRKRKYKNANEKKIELKNTGNFT